MSILKAVNKTNKNTFSEFIYIKSEIEKKILSIQQKDEGDIETELLEATKLVEDSFNLVKYCGEVYFMIPCIILAFLLNCVALYLWLKNELVEKTLKYFIVILVIFDQLYLASLVPYLAFRPRGSDAAYFNGSYQRGDLKYNFVVENSVINNTANLKDLIDPYIAFSSPSNDTSSLLAKTNYSHQRDKFISKFLFKKSMNESINFVQHNTTSFDKNITTHKQNTPVYEEDLSTYDKNFTSFETNITNYDEIVNYTTDPYISLEMFNPSYTKKTHDENIGYDYTNMASNSKNRSVKTFKTHIEVIEGYYFVHYLSVVVGTSQCTSAWLLYLVAVEADSSVRNVVFGARTNPYISKLFPFVIFLLSSFYFSIFLPEIRYLVVNFVNLMYNDFEISNRTYNSINTMYNISQHMNASDNETNFNGDPGPFKHQCDLMPFQNHWDFVLNEVPKNDYFYIIFFSLLYIVSTYVIPYCLLVCKDKNLIDALHASQKVSC